MKQLELTHPNAYSELTSGNHFISCSGQPLSQVSTDRPIDQRRLKVKRRSDWYIAEPVGCNGITSALKAMYGLQDNEQALHKEQKESAPRRVERDEEDVKKITGCFSSGLMIDPFTHDSDALLNIATGVLLPEDVVQNLVHCTEKGRQQMNAFFKKHINSNTVGF